MADLPPLYPADPGSPFTTLAAPYTTGDTTVTLVDASTRPAAPNLLCLEGAGGSCVLLYTGIKGNTLTGVSQIEGPTGTWPAGSYAYRGFAAYDHNALIEHLNALEGMDPLPVGVQGDLLYHNGTAWVVLNAGTDGQVLQTRGAGANPAWADPVAPLPAGTFGDILYHDGTAWVARSTFGISQIAIDADKDWDGKSITNVGIITGRGLQATQKKSYQCSDAVIYQDTTELSGLPEKRPWTTAFQVVVPQGYMTSSFRLKVDIRRVTGRQDRPETISVRFLMNGRVVSGELGTSELEWQTASFDLHGVEPGSVLSVQWSTDNPYESYPSTFAIRNFRVCGDVETYTNRIIGSSDTTWSTTPP